MQENWLNYANAPEQGAIICPASLVEEDATFCLNIKSPTGDFPVIILRKEGSFYGFVNACPHQYLPLNYRAENIISSDKRHLLCSVHGAAFDIINGNCISDTLDSLDSIPLHVNKQGNLCIGYPKFGL
ncbi:Rieske (2Fe-2S) protein [Halomonas campaniensis]|uniref:Rieske (2Fe-2S) protein n=1 Tax=Halomonas campaniensis TaxID=213554 RepID=UPI000B532B66|nr:Rieske 2Fe-2S domain-containing protein [Halomonas campaniensis]